MKIIISAFRESETLMNKYRHKLLKKYLLAEGYNVTEGTGSLEGELEPILIVNLGRPWHNDEMDMFETLALMFEQDYYLVIRNDVVTKFDECTREELGIWWDYSDCSCPDSVKKAVDSGTFTRDDSTGTYYGIRTPEMAKADAFTAAELACELAGGCKCDTPRARSFIYGTPEWLDDLYVY